jgi:hypothetical protein
MTFFINSRRERGKDFWRLTFTKWQFLWKSFFLYCTKEKVFSHLTFWIISPPVFQCSKERQKSFKRLEACKNNDIGLIGQLWRGQDGGLQSRGPRRICAGEAAGQQKQQQRHHPWKCRPLPGTDSGGTGKWGTCWKKGEKKKPRVEAFNIDNTNVPELLSPVIPP